MALLTPIDESPDTVRRTLDPIRNDFSIAVCRAGNPFSVGSIIRVAHSFLAREIFLIGCDPYYAKASMGMEKYETVVGAASESEFLSMTEGRPIWVLEREHATRSLYDAEPFPKDVVLVLGSERDGVPRALIDRANEVLAIPIYGINHSLPVAVAAGIVMSEWARRHYR